MDIVSAADLGALADQVAALDLDLVACHSGGIYRSGALEIVFFDQCWRLDGRNVVDPQGRHAADLVTYVLYQYVLRAPTQLPAVGRRVSFRELSEAGPLAVHFANNTHKTIAQTFADRPGDLRITAERLGGRPVAENHGFDVWMRLDALPRVALYLQFNARDDDFPPQCSLAFDESANVYLDSRSIFILGTYLTGRLLACSGPDEPAPDTMGQLQDPDR